MPKDKQDRAKIIKEISPYLSLGLNFALTVTLFALLGMWIDDMNSTGNLWTLILSLFGVAAGFYKFFKTISDLDKKNKKKKK